MFYYVNISENEIISKGASSSEFELPPNFIGISKEIYEMIGSTPCSFVEENGKIVSVDYIEPAPLPTPPEPTEAEKLKSEIETLKQSIAELTFIATMGGI